MKNKPDHDQRNRWERRQSEREDRMQKNIDIMGKPPTRTLPELENDEMTAVAMTSSLQKIIQSAIEGESTLEAQANMFEHFIGGISFYKERFLKINEPLNRAHSMQQMVDAGVKIDAEKRKEIWAEVTCKAGCSACCHIQVSVNLEEAMLLLAYAFEKEIKLDWELIAKQAEQQKLPEPEYIKKSKADRKCGFLTDAGLCGVYEHRPASCRKYFVANDPKDCDVDLNPSKQTKVLALPSAELIVSGMMDIDHKKIGFLPEMLIKAKELMTMQHCNWCQKTTPTIETDCTVCGLSKGHI